MATNFNHSENAPEFDTSAEHITARERTGEQIVTRSIDNISRVESRISAELNVQRGTAEAVTLTDEALAHIAESTLSSPNASTEDRLDAMEDVVIETAIELTHGSIANKTALAHFHIGEYPGSLDEVSAELHATHATLPNNHEVAPLLDKAISELTSRPLMRQADDFEYTKGAESATILPETSQGSLPPSWKARSISSEFTAPSPERSSRGGGIAETGWQPGLKMDKIPVSFPINADSDAKIEYKAIEDMSKSELAFYGAGKHTGVGSIDFEIASPEAKQAHLTARILEIEAESQSAEARQTASKYNLERVRRGVVVQNGDVIHGFDAQHLRNILNTGLVPGELVGTINSQAPQQDALPYNLDVHDAAATNSIGEHGQLLRNSTNTFYGDITAIIDRAHSSAGADQEVINRDDDHELIFAGVPSTDIRALQLHPTEPYAGRDVNMARIYNAQRQEEAAQQLLDVVNTIVAEGIYIPVYDGDGNLALSLEQYTSRRKNSDFSLAEVPLPDDDIIRLSGQYAKGKEKIAEEWPMDLSSPSDNRNTPIL